MLRRTVFHPLPQRCFINGQEDGAVWLPQAACIDPCFGLFKQSAYLLAPCGNLLHKEGESGKRIWILVNLFLLPFPSVCDTWTIDRRHLFLKQFGDGGFAGVA